MNEEFPIGRKAVPASPAHCYRWGGTWVDFNEAREHFAVVGSTGSGKTVVIRLLLQSLLPRIGTAKGRKIRALIYDAKVDLLSKLYGMGASCHIATLNPMDARGFSWAISEDITTIPDAEELAATIIPDQSSDSQPYFANTARALLGGVVTALCSAVGRSRSRVKSSEQGIYWWGLRDIVLACKSKSRLKAILQSCPDTEDLVEHFANTDTFNNVKSTLDSHVRKFRPIAAAWYHAKGRINLKEWIQAESVLVLGNSDTARQQVDRLNRLIFEQISKLLLNRPGEVQADETWLCLDEMREAGNLPGLRQVLLRGRSKGCAVVLGFQDIGGVDAVYPDGEGRELLGCAKNFAILHLHASAESTRQWASDAIGQVERSKITLSTSEGSGGGQGRSFTFSTNYDRETVPQLLASEFYAGIPKPSAAGIYGVFVGGHTVAKQLLNAGWIFGEGGMKSNSEKPDFVERPAEHYQLPDWTVQEVTERLKISGLLPAMLQEQSQETSPSQLPPRKKQAMRLDELPSSEP